MSSWSFLPQDILEIIFQYLEQDFHISIHPTKSIKVQSNDTFQCQFTCKNWTSLAQRKIYKRVILKSIQQLKSFTHTLQNNSMGSLVEHIYLQPEKKETEIREALLIYIQIMATFCTFLKTLYMDSSDFQDIWKLIRDERSKGNFTRLQFIPFVKDQTNENILDYGDAAFSLQQTLRELAIYDKNISLDKSKLWHFPNASTVFFKFDDPVDTRFINRHMKWLPSVTGAEIDFNNREPNQDQVNTESPIHISPHLKQLSVKTFFYSNVLSNYIMKAFPNLQKMIVKVEYICYYQAPMSTDEIVKFLEYLLDIPELSVSCIPVVNQNDVLLGLHGKSRHIKELKISYMGIPYFLGSSYLNIATCPNVKEKIVISVIYKADIPPLLPHIGLMEQSGKDLRYLEINMGLGLFGMISMKPDSENGVTFSGILQQCPHLLGICIQNAILNTFGSQLQLQDRIEIRDYITFNKSLIHSAFLQSLSFYVSYIFQFTLRGCRFMDEVTRGSIREINMANTEFYNIVYDDWALTDKVYLKLTKTINNTISWYMAQDYYINVCTEKDYEDSLQDQDILSLFIRCKDAFQVRISLPKLDVVFKP
ncbi:hypothetical protein BDF21DRAFT_460437 [Thamnidium elegans]|nr:hypothetical protein BDF21DRAFT_460437 [Thamnidium elegans]